jgi:hypothetical protein
MSGGGAHAGIPRLLVRAGLRFEDDGLERAFRDSIRERFERLIWIGMVLGALTFASYGLWDKLAGTEHVRLLSFRFTIATPILLGFALVAYCRWIRPDRILFLCAYAVATGALATYVTMLYLPDAGVGPASGGHALTFALMIAFATAVFPLYTGTSIAVSLTLLATYIAGLLVAGDGRFVQTSSFVNTLLNTCVVMVFAAYGRERLARGEFANAAKLETENRQLTQLVQRLVPEEFRRSSDLHDVRHTPALKIVLSYRRMDSDAIAGRIRDRLVIHFGDKAVFMDIDSIEAGKDFRSEIGAALKATDVLVAVIGPRWFGPSRAAPRLSQEDDPVRVELEIALREAIPVIPVLVGGAKMPAVPDLPASLAPLAFRNAIEVDTGRDFHAHVSRLIRSMEQIVVAKESELHNVEAR